MLLNSPQKPNIDTLYFIYDDDASNAKLYLGEKLIAGGNSSTDIGDIVLSDLHDVSLNAELKNKSILVYDSSQHKWVDSTIENALSVFIGASENAAGIPGLVPAPALGETNLYLRSDGTWATIDVQDKANVWTIENEDSSRMHQDIIDEATADILLNPGDIIIIKDIIVGDKWQHTSYVYTGSVWAAMDGNYNAENVYFDEDFIFTTPVGTVTIPSSGSIEVNAAGKNIREFLAGIFAKEIEPTKSNPYIYFNSPSTQSYEVGTKLEPSYSLGFNSGSYTYNDSTGVTVTSWSITDSLSKTATTQSGKMPEIQLADGMTYTISATANYSDGIVPSTNLGNPCEDKQIKSGTTSKVTSNKITGYRKMFGGMDATQATLTSDWIRTNLQSVSTSITWSAADLAGVKRYILAIPANSGKTLKSAIMTSSMNADATADYKKQTATVKVEGANGYTAIDYNIWIYEPASIANNEVHQLTIG